MLGNSDLYALSFMHGVYFYGKYIYTNGDEKEAERDMYPALLYFRSSNDQDWYEKRENHLENFFMCFSLTLAQKCHYIQLKLTRVAY